MVAFGIPRRTTLRLATVLHQGRARVGRLDADARRLQLFDIDGSRGALPVIEAAAAGAALPGVAETIDLDPQALMAPLPRPRRNLFCVGRNYRDHAKELS